MTAKQKAKVFFVLCVRIAFTGIKSEAVMVQERECELRVVVEILVSQNVRVR